MTTSDKIFGNIFDRKTITNLRLSNFAEDCLSRFATLAIEDQFATNISEITIALDNLRSEMGDVDTRLSTQKVKTVRTDQFVEQFKQTMRHVEGMIIHFNGGKDSDLYREMYPHGIKEYSKVNKTKMPILMNRMNDIATRYGTQLSTDLSIALAALKTQWKTVRTDQEKQMTKVDDSRVDRTVARKQLEKALMGAIHAVATEFLLEVDQCERFFNFNMLTAVVHHEGKEGDEGDEGDDAAAKTMDAENTEAPETPQEVAE